jgi:DNA-directed RNA polymerase subunit RPC12/RpoP
MIIKIQVIKDGYKCERCGHTWLPRANKDIHTDIPVRCSKCNSVYWNKPRKNKYPKKAKQNE